MSKLGAASRGLYLLIAFLLNTALRVGLNLSLIISVGMTFYAVGKFSSQAIKERKEGIQKRGGRQRQRRGLSDRPSDPSSSFTWSPRTTEDMAQPKFRRQQKEVYVPATDFVGRVLDLIYWRDPKKSGIALSLALIALFILGRYPLLSVIAYTGLAVVAATLGFRIFKSVEGQIKKTGGENPFQEFLAKDLTVPQDRVHAQVDVLVEHGNCLANQIKRLVFVDSILDTAKFGLFLWSLTYIASWFSGCALAFLAIVGTFSIPKLYETYQEPIDANLAVVKQHLQNVQNTLEEKLPFLRRTTVEVEKKEQ
ncbi:unnamed protein product [Caenorhabditis auriculariae]|uniref:Reticulon-like protein n=1 Tax=Caenorhabditis auriculariae TaxID=2777116 RepID=A0A8S1GTR7_9PELO|nr:unnamed protein product [Caenorhabditis auriculariae]